MIFTLLVIFGLIGSGTEIRHDCGHWSHSKDWPGLKPGERKWTPVYEDLVFVGVTDEEWSSFIKSVGWEFVKKGQAQKGGSVGIGLWDVRVWEIRKIRRGPVDRVSMDDVSVPIRKR